MSNVYRAQAAAVFKDALSAALSRSGSPVSRSQESSGGHQPLNGPRAQCLALLANNPDLLSRVYSLAAMARHQVHTGEYQETLVSQQQQQRDNLTPLETPRQREPKPTWATTSHSSTSENVAKWRTTIQALATNPSATTNEMMLRLLQVLNLQQSPAASVQTLQRLLAILREKQQGTPVPTVVSSAPCEGSICGIADSAATESAGTTPGPTGTCRSRDNRNSSSLGPVDSGSGPSAPPSPKSSKANENILSVA
jgi:hypothetical protein